jgi:hypothetical protein
MAIRHAREHVIRSPHVESCAARLGYSRGARVDFARASVCVGVCVCVCRKSMGECLGSRYCLLDAYQLLRKSHELVRGRPWFPAQ